MTFNPDSVNRIKGREIVLDRFTPACITDEYLSWLNNRDLMKYSRQSKLTHTRESCLAYVQTFAGTANFFWSVRLIEGDVQIGTMTAYVDEKLRSADIGILIAHPAVRGRGTGEQCWAMAMSFLFDHLQILKITGGTLAPHSRMRSIFERWGMQLEQVLPEHEVLAGTAYDVVRYGIGRDEWLAVNGRPSVTIETDAADPVAHDKV